MDSSTTQTIVQDIAFGESSRWRAGRVWFCDWIDGEVISVAPDGSDRIVHAALGGFPICIDWDLEGRLLLVVGAAQKLFRQVSSEDGGTDDIGRARLEAFADLTAVSDKPWNEIVTHPSGRVYVNGVGFDMMIDETATTGQIAVVETDGSVREVAEGLAFPNGMAVTEDGSTLVVAESHGGRISSFPILGNGDLGSSATFAEIPGSAPDGLCINPDGSVWYADVPNQHCQRVVAGGEVMETIELDRGCFSCARSPSGDLYVTATVWDADTFSTRRGVLVRVDRSPITPR